MFPDYAINVYLNRICDSAKNTNFSGSVPKLEHTYRQIELRYGIAAAMLLNKLALISSVKESLIRLNSKDYPGSVVDHYIQWFLRAEKDAGHQPDSYYHHTNVVFRKDLAVCSLRSIPIGGAWLLEIGRIGGRSLILNSGIPQLIKYLRTVIHATRGFKPFYVMHVFERYILRLNNHELMNAYRRIAELLRRNTKIKGLYRASWLLDPHLDTISPHLRFNRRIPQDHGAHFFKSVADAAVIKNAITLSPERKTLYEQAKYQPQVHAFIWPRREILRWAESQDCDSI